MSSNDQQLLLAELKDRFPDFKCTLQDLRNPTEEFVTNFYSFWLQEFEVDINNVIQTQFTQTTVVNSYLDAYSGMIPKGNLLKSIRAFDVVPDFGILDIVSPTPKRIQNILRAFLNFHNWADYHIACMREKNEILCERKKMLSKIITERETCKENLNNIIKNIAKIQDTKSQLEEEVVLLQHKLSEIKLEREIFKTKTNESNKKLEEKENILKKINKEDSQVDKKLKDYSNQIVDSPSTIHADLEQLRLRNEEMNELLNQKRDMVESKMQAHNKLQNVLEDHQQRPLQLEELLKLIEHYRELLQIVSTTEKSTTASQEQLKELKSLLISQNNKKINRQESLKSLYLRWKTLKPQLTESVESAIRELTNVKNAKNKINKSLKEDVKVQENIDSLLKNIKTHIEIFEIDYNKLLMQENEHLEIIESSLNSHMESAKKETEKKYNKK